MEVAAEIHRILDQDPEIEFNGLNRVIMETAVHFNYGNSTVSLCNAILNK